MPERKGAFGDKSSTITVLVVMHVGTTNAGVFRLDEDFACPWFRFGFFVQADVFRCVQLKDFHNSINGMRSIREP